MTDEPRPLIGRLTPRHWRQLDHIAAVAICVGTYGEEHAVASGRALWLLVLLAVWTSAPLAVRRRWPMTVLVVVASGALALAAIGAAPLVNLAYASYTVAVAAPARRALIAVPVTVACLTAGLFIQAPTSPASAGHLQSAAEVLAVVWAAAVLIRQHRANTALAAAHAADRLAEHLGRERLRIARDLHDVVAHSMSLITVQAGVAGYVVDRRPEQAKSALASIESTSRGALVELRRLLGVLREEGDGAGGADPADLAPAPGLADLPALVARSGAGGLRIRFETHLDAVDVALGVQVAAYRIVQEALTNIVRHARADSAEVSVTDHDGGLELVIENGPGRHHRRSGAAQDPWHRPGHGLIGMRERAALCGGHLEAGATAEGGFRVSAWLPVEHRLATTERALAGPR